MLLLFAYYISKSIRSENSIEDNNSCIENTSGDPGESSSENQGDNNETVQRHVCNDDLVQGLSDSFNRVSTSGIHDVGSVPAEFLMKTIPLQRYEDLIQIQSQVEELKISAKRMEDIIIAKNAEISELKNAHEREKKTWKEFHNLSPVNAEGIFFNIFLTKQVLYLLL